MSRTSVAVPPSKKVDPSKCRAPRGDTVRDLLENLRGSRTSRRLSQRTLEDMGGDHPPTTGKTERVQQWVNAGEEDDDDTSGTRNHSSFHAALQSENDTENTPIGSGELQELAAMMPRRGGTSEFGGEKDTATVADTEEESDEDGESLDETRSINYDTVSRGSHDTATTHTHAHTNPTTLSTDYTVTTNTETTNTNTTAGPKSYMRYERAAPSTFDTQYRAPPTGGYSGGPPTGGPGGNSYTFRGSRISFGTSYAGRTFGALLDRFLKKDILTIFQIIVRRWSQMVPHIRWFFKQVVAFFSGLAHLKRAIGAFLSFLRKDERTRQLVDRIAMASGTTLRVLLVIITAIYEGIIFSHWLIKDRAIPFFQENIPKCYNSVMKMLYQWAEDTPWVAMLGPFSFSFAIHENRLPARRMPYRPHQWKDYRPPESSYFTQAIRSMRRAAASTTAYGTGTFSRSFRRSNYSTESSSDPSSRPPEGSDVNPSDAYTTTKSTYFEGTANDPSIVEGSSCTPNGSEDGSDAPAEGGSKGTRVPVAKELFFRGDP